MTKLELLTSIFVFVIHLSLMPEDKPRLARLTAIITQLQTKSMVTAREIAEKHQVSIRTVYRDIRTLEQSGIPVYSMEGIGYSLVDGYQLPPVMFSEEEANSLITAGEIILKNSDDSLSQSYASALDKVKSVLRTSQKNKSNLLSERIQIRTQDKEKNSSKYLIQIQSAITNFKVLHLKYFSLSEKLTEREVEPFALIHTQGNWVLIAYCRLRKDFRLFRLDRIKSLSELALNFPPHQMTLDQYFKEARKKWENNSNLLETKKIDKLD